MKSVTRQGQLASLRDIRLGDLPAPLYGLIAELLAQFAEGTLYDADTGGISQEVLRMFEGRLHEALEKVMFKQLPPGGATPGQRLDQAEQDENGHALVHQGVRRYKRLSLGGPLSRLDGVPATAALPRSWVIISPNTIATRTAKKNDDRQGARDHDGRIDSDPG